MYRGTKLCEKLISSFLTLSTKWPSKRLETREQETCAMSHPKPDCNQRFFLTRLITEVSGSKNSVVQFVPDTEASFSVISKPKIDNIDYRNVYSRCSRILDRIFLHWNQSDPTFATNVRRGKCHTDQSQHF